MTKGVKICIAAVIILFLGAVAALIIMNRSAETAEYVEILQDNTVIYRIDINENEGWHKRIETADGGWNDVIIENSEIFVTDANCGDKTCCRLSPLKNNTSPIVCLPHKLIIRFSEDSGDDK